MHMIKKKNIRRCVKCLQFSFPEATAVKSFLYVLSKVVYMHLSLPFCKTNYSKYTCCSAPSLHLAMNLSSGSKHGELHHDF